MAMQQITKKCPYCARIYEQRSCGSFGRRVTPEDVWTYGSPVKLCDSCKRIFVDKDVKELAITGLRKSDTAKVSPRTLALLPAGAVLAALLYAAGQPVFAAVALGIALLYFLMDLCLYPMRMRKLDRERAASEKRLSDPDYAQILAKAGIPVPESYLKGK